ncbi:MAG: GNAT family N-acetyltransferase [Bacteroidales bacterium]|nr:GNAT family N-acetyltransferase [Bacteroidales bacterium]
MSASSDIKVTLIRGIELTHELKEIWKRIQDTSKDLESPFFHPEFTYAVSLNRQDSYIAILEENNAIIGFLPFHRDNNGKGTPIGFGISDYQGIIIDENRSIDFISLLEECKIQKWYFDHQITSQAYFREFSHTISDSPIINLEFGYEKYKAQQYINSNVIKKIEKQIRRFEKEIGKLDFVINEKSVSQFEILLKWKIQHLKELGKRHKLCVDWVSGTMEHIRNCSLPDFEGMVSVLFIQNKTIAVEFGISSQKILHGWVSSYDKEFCKYSPGLILQLKLIQNANKKIIDLGKGAYSYKQRFMNSKNSLFEGMINI